MCLKPETMNIMKFVPLSLVVITQVNYLGLAKVNHKFTRAQIKLTRAWALLGASVDMPLVS